MLQDIREYIQQRRLLDSKEKIVIVGLSGGADSVALLAILIQLGYPCLAAHCNFHLRGEESNRDERFAAEIAEQLNATFIKTDFNTDRYAKTNHLSIETAARELRYQWFEELRIKTQAQAIAVAHHKDDNAETVLHNLIRGTGIKGLRGMKPKNNYIIRPLLQTNKKDILNWLSQQNLPSVIDSTNLTETCTRNTLRLRIIPLLRELNPNVNEAIARTAQHLSDIEKIYESAIDQARNTIMRDSRININELLRLPAPETILYELLSPYNYPSHITHSIFKTINNGAEAGKIFYSSTHKLATTRTHLHITPLPDSLSNTYTIEEDTRCLDCNQAVFTFNSRIVDKLFRPTFDKNFATLDYDKLKFPLTIRRWHPGDSFIPFGMNGRKKLSDYFTDHKYSRIDKDNALIICSGDDIVWIAGERIDNRYRITVDSQTAFIIEYNPNALT